MQRNFDWTAFASELSGPRFGPFQRELTKFNHHRLEPALPGPGWREEVRDLCHVLRAEGEFVEAARREIAPIVSDIPETVDGFISWFEGLRADGPGQGDPLFPWLAARATMDEMRWFIEQEVAGGAGFDGFLA